MTRKLVEDRIVIATHNSGKLAEIETLLRPFGVSVTSASELGLEVPEETETTFAGNARIKAHAAAGAANLPALSDDSGLAVDALGGDPGVLSADWAETPDGRDFSLAMGKVWTAIEANGAPAPHRARFCCTLCLAWPDGGDEIFEGRVDGTLVWPPRGTRGFGYDPMFRPEGETITFGEMDPDRKQAMSHRADAFHKLITACFA